jgi:Phosphate transporter family
MQGPGYGRPQVSFPAFLAGPILQKGAFSLGCAVAQDKFGSAWLEFCSRKKGYGLATKKLHAGSKKVALGTVGRIVTTLGERLGKQKLVPAQGGSAELAAAAAIGTAGFTGFPVSTTLVSGTMVGLGAGLQPSTAWQIATAWVLTLPATIVLSGRIFYLLS